MSGLDVPVLLDGAQGAGAIPVDVGKLGCAFYAASGQKWLCGPVGTGLLWISPEYAERVRAIGPTYANLEDPAAGLDAVPKTTAARHDAYAQSLETAVAAATAFVLLATTGWDEVHERAAVAGGLARRRAERARLRGRAARSHDARLVEGP